MDILRNRQAALILLLHLSGVICNSMIIPFMAFYIVEGLGQEPWQISVYTAVALVLAFGINRQFGEWIDGGARIAPLVLLSIVSFVAACVVIVGVQQYWVLPVIASIGFSLSAGAMVTMLAFGRMFAEREELDTDKFNALLRASHSLGWMIGPAAAFVVADRFAPIDVFRLAIALAVVWGVLWYLVVPKDFAKPVEDRSQTNTGVDPLNRPLWYAAIACFFLALAHMLCTSALPLFYVQEAGLPTYAPGLSFSIKTFVEIIAILSVPRLMRQWGARNVLMATCVLAVISFLVLAQVATLPGLAIGAALEGLYYGIFAGVGISFVQSFAGGRVARATSFYVNSLIVGGLIAGPSMGLIAQFYDFRSAILLASLGAVAAFAMLFATRRSDVTASAIARETD